VRTALSASGAFQIYRCAPCRRAAARGTPGGRCGISASPQRQVDTTNGETGRVGPATNAGPTWEMASGWQQGFQPQIPKVAPGALRRPGANGTPGAICLAAAEKNRNRGAARRFDSGPRRCKRPFHLRAAFGVPAGTSREPRRTLTEVVRGRTRACTCLGGTPAESPLGRRGGGATGSKS